MTLLFLEVIGSAQEYLALIQSFKAVMLQCGLLYLLLVCGISKIGIKMSHMIKNGILKKVFLSTYSALACGAGVFLPGLSVPPLPSFLISAVCRSQTFFKSFYLQDRASQKVQVITF